MKFSLFSLIIFCCITSFCQESRLQKRALTGTLSVLSPRRIAVQPGFAFRFGKRWELLTEIALPVTTGRLDRFEALHMFRLNSELKFSPRNFDHGNYFSVQLGYVHRNGTDNDSGVYQQGGSYSWFSYKKAEVKSPVISFAVKIGGEVSQTKKMLIDIFTGIGWRIIFTHYEAQDLKPHSRIRRPDAGPEVYSIPSMELNGTLARFHFVVGMRLGKRW